MPRVACDATCLCKWTARSYLPGSNSLIKLTTIGRRECRQIGNKESV